MRLFFFLAGCFIAVTTASAEEQPPKARAILVLDASGSMWGQIDGQNKIVIARDVVGELIGSWDPEIHLGLTAYGHRRKGDCADIEDLVTVGPIDGDALTSVVNGINPKGKTPLSAAVQQAAERLKYTEEAATVILVTDGLETCNADPCAVASILEQSGVDFTAHVVGFDLSEEESKQVQCVAENTGGQYFSAGNASELRDALGSVVETVQASVVADTIHVVLAEGQDPIEGESVSFKYFPASDANSSKPNQVGYGYGAKGRPSLEPGDYFARVKLGSGEIDLPFTVDAEERREFTANLNAGRLGATAQLDESSGQADASLGWKIFALGPDGKPTRNQVGYAYGPSPKFVLPAGDYSVEVKLGSATASAVQSIAAGKGHDLRIDLRAGTVSYNAVLTEGAAPYQGDMGWKAYAIDADGTVSKQQATYSYNTAGQYTLTAGKYQLRAKAGSIERAVDVEILPGKDVSVTVNLNGGIVNYEVLLTEGGKRVGGSPGWKAHPVDADGSVGKQIAYSYTAAGRYALPAGEVELQVKEGAVNVSKHVTVIAGETTDAQIVLNAGYVSFAIVDEAGKPLSGNPGWKVYPLEDGKPSSKSVAYGYSDKGTVLLVEGAYELRVKGKAHVGSTRIDAKAGETITVTAETAPAP